MTLFDLFVAMPEMMLAVIAFVALIFGAVCGNRVTRAVDGLAVLGFVLAAFVTVQPERLVHMMGDTGTTFGFNYMFVDSAFTHFTKIIVLIAGAAAVLLAPHYNRNQKQERFEYSVLIMFAVLGMMLMISASDLIALYVGLELQSLALYVLAASHRDNARSSEAGLKYFVLGALSSGLLLYGISLLYGYAGSTEFVTLAFRLREAQPLMEVVVGLVLVVAALAFKVSAVPFHMWTPDVYEGAPTPVAAFFASAPKVAALALFVRVMLLPMGGLVHQWTQILVFVAVASMLVGSFAGIMQKNLKRLMAYSSIANVGFALVAIAVHSALGLQALLIYLAIYFANTLGAFAVILCLNRDGKPVETISDLSGLGKTNPLLALAMVIFMFSMAGVPPLAGFFGKYFVFLAAVKAGMVPLAVIGVLTSVVSAFYYIRIVKVMYFDEVKTAIDPVSSLGVKFVLLVSALYMVAFTLYPSPVIDKALQAANAMLPG